MVNHPLPFPTRSGYTARKAHRDQEQAIMLCLLEMPEFRRKAGLPPRAGGDTLQTIATLMGVSRESVRLIERRALHKIRAAVLSCPECRAALEFILSK